MPGCCATVDILHQAEIKQFGDVEATPRRVDDVCPLSADERGDPGERQRKRGWVRTRSASGGVHHAGTPVNRYGIPARAAITRAPRFHGMRI